MFCLTHTKYSSRQTRTIPTVGDEGSTPVQMDTSIEEPEADIGPTEFDITKIRGGRPAVKSGKFEQNRRKIHHRASVGMLNCLMLFANSGVNG